MKAVLIYIGFNLKNTFYLEGKIMYNLLSFFGIAGAFLGAVLLFMAFIATLKKKDGLFDVSLFSALSIFGTSAMCGVTRKLILFEPTKVSTFTKTHPVVFQVGIFIFFLLIFMSFFGFLVFTPNKNSIRKSSKSSKRNASEIIQALHSLNYAKEDIIEVLLEMGFTEEEIITGFKN